MITIVMPVYNTGVYLKESIESILNQTYGDFELICVDDCSKDALTLELLDAYEQADERIRIVRLPENVGAAEARNIGLKQAEGEYIIFLDADDIFDEDMLEKMHQSLESSDADMCVCGHRIYSEQSKSVVQECQLRNIPGITDRVFSVKELGEEGLLFWAPVPWNKMCGTEFLRRNNIFFQNLSSSNDVFYALMCCLIATGIVYCDERKPLLTYRTQNENQISANRTPINFWWATKKILESITICEDDVRWLQIMCSLVVGIIYEINSSIDEGKRNECYEIIRAFIQVNKKKLNFKNRRFQTYVSFFLENKYESKWFEKVGDFERQLEELDDAVMSSLMNSNRNIVVWGNGKRGQAFQSYCKKKGIMNIHVTDRKNEAIGECTEFGYQIVDSESVFGWADIIVASNYNIYEGLLIRQESQDLEIINLQKYCPLE